MLVPPSSFRGRRECPASDAPAAACAEIVELSTRVRQVTPETSGIPRAMVYGLFRNLPGDRAFLSPSLADIAANLTPASRRQDHTTSPSASALSSRAPLASTASRPAFVTIASRPSVWDGTVADIKLIWVRWQAQFLKFRNYFEQEHPERVGHRRWFNRRIGRPAPQPIISKAGRLARAGRKATPFDRRARAGTRIRRRHCPQEGITADRPGARRDVYSDERRHHNDFRDEIRSCKVPFRCF